MIEIPYLLPRCEPIVDDGYEDFDISTMANVQVILKYSCIFKDFNLKTIAKYSYDF